MMRKLVTMVPIIAVILSALVGTGSAGTPVEAASVRTSGHVHPQARLLTAIGASITASADLLPAGSTLGSTNVSWNTGNGTVGQVFLTVNGGTENLWAQGASSSVTAPWIAAGSTYVFSLYAGTSHTSRLGQVTVILGTAATAFLSINLSPVPQGSTTTTVAWNVGVGQAQVYVSAEGGTDVLIGQGTNASVSIPWISPQTIYVFKLFAGTGHSTLLASQSVSQATAAPSVSATPNPVPAASTGTTRVTWTTGDGTVGQLYVSVSGGTDVLVGQGSGATVSIPWIYGGNTYVFKLFAGTGHASQLASQTVTMSAPVVTLTATPNPVVSPSTTTTVAWDTGDGSVGQLYVSVNGGTDVLVGQGSTASVSIPWISSGNTFVFKLYAGILHVTLLNSVSVHQSAPPACTGNADQCYVLGLINQARATFNIPALTLDQSESNNNSTSCGAWLHSYDMAQTGQIWHYAPANYPQYNGESFPNGFCNLHSLTIYGQNVGASWGNGSENADLQSIHNSMMAENPNTPNGCAALPSGQTNHACNILSTAYTRVGIGIYVDTGGVSWLTEDFEG